MQRRNFLRNVSILGAVGVMNSPKVFATAIEFPIVRRSKDKRNFSSPVIENAIVEFQKNVKNKELAWLFGNCFPNTLDTTVFYSEKNSLPDTYVITGDIDVMWMRDSSAQVWPYMQFAAKDPKIHSLIAGVINRQTHYILEDPFANAFYKDDNQKSEWETDMTDMKPGIHERKWEIDSLCYPIRLAYHFWKITGDTKPFTEEWVKAIETIYNTFIDQQKKTGDGKYHFQRKTEKATDTQPMHGYGYPVNPIGLISSAFRPSDDATVYSFLIPSNFFAVTSLRQAAEILEKVKHDNQLATQLNALAQEVEVALKKHAIMQHPEYGQIYAFEINGFGGLNPMDDANVPSLLAMPYLGTIDKNDKIYQNTRAFVWSKSNPYFYKGSVAEGIGGPHVGKDMIWPMSIIIRGLTSDNTTEIKQCIQMLMKSHAGTGFMHESFHKDDAKNFTRSWFAWTNTLFGEFLWKVYKENKSILNSI